MTPIARATSDGMGDTPVKATRPEASLETRESTESGNGEAIGREEKWGWTI